VKREDPSSYPARVLLAVVGLTPQVVTETLHALVISRRPAFRPTRLRLVTTGEGAERIRLQLLDRDSGAFQDFSRQYAPELSSILSNATVDVLDGSDGDALDDIADADASSRAADRIVAIVREETARPDASIWASIAGGRKTMGFLLGYAMSLFGRRQDRLSHVLVNAPFEGHAGFFFPPRVPKVIFAQRDGKPVRTDDARIVLHEIPFLRLRDGLPTRMLQGRAGFAATIAEAQSALQPARLLLHVANCTAQCGKRHVRVPPVEFAFLLWLARRRRDGAPSGGAVNWRTADASEFLLAHALVARGTAQAARVRMALKLGMPKEWLEQRITRINKLFEDALGLAAGPYLLRRVGVRPTTSHGLSPELTEVRIVEKKPKGTKHGG
jgi:CRISPR-associated protein (TIGR02584 family)